MKKTMLISFGILALVILIAIPIAIKIKKPVDNLLPQIIDTKIDEKMVRNIGELVPYNGELPDAQIEFTGKYSAVVTLQELKDKIPVYEFEAGIDDIYGTHLNKYVGINYYDLIRYLYVPNNTQTTFISDRKSVGYRPSEIDYEKTFIVFYMDGKPIGNSQMTLLAVNYNYLYSVEGLTTINYQ